MAKKSSIQPKAPVPAPPSASRVFEKTPMFCAMHALRYQRQMLIRQIEETNPTLFCFVAGIRTVLSKDDAIGFNEMLFNAQPGEPIDLLLHTPGGDVDAAEKLITMVRKSVGEDGQLRVIVPDFAKSAGTLMTLDANSIVMSDSSELGPIDPQIWTRDSDGNDICYSVLDYLTAYDRAQEELRKTPDDPVALLTFNKFDPTIYRKYTSVRKRARNFAEAQLKRRGRNFSMIASALMDTDTYPSHGQMIDWQEATKIGLNIEYLQPQDPNWRRYWELYCHLRLAIEDNQRILNRPMCL